MESLKRRRSMVCWAVCLGLLLGGCASRLPSTLGEARKNTQAKAQDTIEGKVPAIDGSILDLKVVGQKPFVIIFAAESCSSCRQETEHLLSLFQQKGGLPKNISLATILIASDLEGATGWTQSFGLPILWTVAFDSDLNLYEKFFSTIQTPSLLVGDGQGRVSALVGAQSVETLEKETGPWSF